MNISCIFFFLLLFYFSVLGVGPPQNLVHVIDLVLLCVRHLRHVFSEPWDVHTDSRDAEFIGEVQPFPYHSFSKCPLGSSCSGGLFCSCRHCRIPQDSTGKGVPDESRGLSSWGILIPCSPKTFFHFDLSSRFQTKTIFCAEWHLYAFSPVKFPSSGITWQTVGVFIWSDFLPQFPKEHKQIGFLIKVIFLYIKTLHIFIASINISGWRILFIFTCVYLFVYVCTCMCVHQRTACQSPFSFCHAGPTSPCSHWAASAARFGLWDRAVLYI